LSFDPETIARLQEAASIVVGTVSPTGEPHAGRGWGMVGSDDTTDAIRVLLDGSDAVTIGHCEARGQVALTVANVRTLRSMQMKGTAVEVCPVTAEDDELTDRYCDDFFRAIVETDNYPREALEGWRPSALVACTIRIESMYDQTPGPRAGAAVSEGAA
jgi:hypothetical protein